MTSSAPADEWNSVVLAQECGDLAVLAVLEDLLKECEQLLFERQVQRKLLPFTVDQVKRELLDSVYVQNTYTFKILIPIVDICSESTTLYCSRLILFN